MPFVIWTQCYFCCILGGLINPLFVFYFRAEDKFAGGKFREIPFAVDIIFAGGKFRAKSKFAKIAKIYSTRKIGVILVLAGTTWGAGAKTLRTSALALCYSVAEYCAPVWRNSAHTNLVDVQLNNTMMAITGAVRCTRTDWLPVLSNIAPADIRREVATSRMILRARGKPELPLFTGIDFHPRPRLKSRRPIWSNLEYLYTYRVASTHDLNAILFPPSSENTVGCIAV